MILTSRYSGKCNTCGDYYAAGALISWVRGVKGASHATCVEEGKKAAEVSLASRAVDAEIDIPAPEGKAYLPYQRAGIAYALARPGTLIADEMGLGKTIQAIGVINADETIKSVLIQCPKSLKYNWRNELQKWLTRPLTVGIADSGYVPKTDIVIVNYDIIKKLGARLMVRDFDCVIGDEIHMIKNPKAQRTQAARPFFARAKRRLGLSGTPFENRPIELWPILQVVDPEAWDPTGRKGKPAGSGEGFFRFAKRYCGAVQTNYGWDFTGATNLPELQHKLRSTCMVRRLKADVLTELPPKRRTVVELEGGEAAVKRERAAWDRLEEELEGAKVAVELARADSEEAYREAVKRLQQASSVAFNELAQVRHATALAKLPAALEHIDSVLEGLDGGKVLIFAHHRDVIAKIVEHYAGHGVVSITGDTGAEERQSVVDRFQTDSRVRVFVGNIQAAGVGLTLTAASTVVFVELDWTPAKVSQAEDRAHRIGQRDTVNVQHLVLTDSLDARMAKLVVEKQEIAEKALDRELVTEPVIPSTGSAATTATQREIAELAEKLAPADVQEIHAGLQRLAGMCNGAVSWDGAGFSKIDVKIGHALAMAPRLSQKQAALGFRLCRKYRRQLGEGVWSRQSAA